MPDIYSSNSKEMVGSALLRTRASDHPDRLFVSVDDDGVTYREADGNADQIANGLRSLGMLPGERVAYLLGYRVEVPSLIFGTIRVGGTNVILNPYLRGLFLMHQLQDCGATTLVVDAEGFRSVKNLINQLHHLRRLVLLEPISSMAPGDLSVDKKAIDYAELISIGDPTPDTERLPSDPFALVYTSGTTGQPKACILSDAYMNRIGRAYGKAWGCRAEDVIFTATPLYHISGYIGILTALAHGASLVVDGTFKASTYIERAGSVGATIAYGVGFHSLAILKQPGRETDRRHSLRFGWFGPFSPEDQRAFEERFGFTLVSEMYAQTECALVSYGVVGDTGSRDTAGRVVGDVELRIVDGHELEVPQGEVGEIVLRPLEVGALFSGYWNCSEATVAAWRNLWHHTGDLGLLDANGYLRFVDRKVDSIRRRGEMVSAHQLEQVILTHPKIADVACIAVRLDSEVDDMIKACIVTVTDQELTLQELSQFFAAELPYFAIPRFVELVSDLPRNASGRVLKFELRKRPLECPPTWDLEEAGLTPDREDRRNVPI